MQEQELVFEFLRREKPKTYDEIIKLRFEDPQRAQTSLQIITEEINGQDLQPYDLVCDKQYIKDLTERYTNTEGIIYLDNFLNIKSLRQIAQLLTQSNNQLFFPISRDVAVQGKITNKIFNYKKRIPVCFHTTHRKAESNHVFFFNEKINQKEFRINQTLHAEFWVYHFHTAQQEYILLSESELDCEDYIIEGTFVEVEDNPLFGSTARLVTKIPLIFVHKAIKRIPRFKSHKEMFQAVKKQKLTRDVWFNNLFTHQELQKSFRHPKLFEQFISAYLLAAKQDYYLHVLIIADAGSGKSTLEECLWQKFCESQDIVGCGQSTLKALVPSFKTQPPSAGALINASRICVVDEFLRILINIDPRDREYQLGRLNDLLENRNRAFESGQGRVLGKMTSKFLGVTNPVWGTRSMEKLIDYVDPSFVSRVMVWYQDKNHLRWVFDEKGKGTPISNPLNKYFFLALYDYFQSFVSHYDDEEVKKVFKECRRLLEDQPSFFKVLGIYDARYLHHARCLLDGIVKTRCLLEGDDGFVAKSVDYEVLQNIFQAMIVNWGVYVKMP
jgi:hypothetical protein